MWALDNGAELMPIGVTEAKKHATGRGNATKAEVMQAMRALGHDPQTEDESDALAVWYCARERMHNV
jgi:Holliday junction resolvasome RuvABC endonuclease subunit